MVVVGEDASNNIIKMKDEKIPEYEGFIPFWYKQVSCLLVITVNKEINPNFLSISQKNTRFSRITRIWVSFFFVCRSHSHKIKCIVP